LINKIFQLFGSVICHLIAQIKTRLTSEGCSQCLSGQVDCKTLDNQCWMRGLCHGMLITEVSFWENLITKFAYFISYWKISRLSLNKEKRTKQFSFNSHSSGFKKVPVWVYKSTAEKHIVVPCSCRAWQK